MVFMVEKKNEGKKVAKKKTITKVKKEQEKNNVKKENKNNQKTVKTKKTENIIEKKEIVETKNEAKTEQKKVENKKIDNEKTTEKKEIKKKKYFPKEKKENKEKSSQAKENWELLQKNKKRLPTFRGRFGKKNIRRKSKDKWNKWRKPRGIDLDKGLQHGYRPKIGYRNKKEIRGIHPSGYIEVRIENVKDLEKIDVKKEAIKIGSTVGKRKRNEIIKKANEKKIWILN